MNFTSIRMSICGKLPPNTHAYRLYLVKDQKQNFLALGSAAISEALHCSTRILCFSNYFQTRKNLAETEGFEPSMRLYTPYSLSRGAPSATRSRFQSRYYASFWRGSRRGLPSPNDAMLPKTMGGLQVDFVQTTRRSASKAQGDTPLKRTNTRNTLTTRRTQTSPRLSANRSLRPSAPQSRCLP